MTTGIEAPVVFQYQQALDAYRREGREPPLLKRMSELISLLDLTTTLSSGLTSRDILDAALLIVMGELQAGRGALLVQSEPDLYSIQAARGLAAGTATSARIALRTPDVLHRNEAAAACDALGVDLICPVFKAGRPIAAFALGRRASGSFGEADEGFLRTLAACAATPIENGLITEQLRSLNRRLSVKVFQLNNLFDISRELTQSQDEESIRQLVTTTLMGHLMVSRSALYLRSGEALHVVCERGVRTEGAASEFDASAQLLAGLAAARDVATLADGPVKRRLEQTRMAWIVPLSVSGLCHGFIALGARASGAPFTEEDGDFAHTLGRQALAALESVRLQKMRLAKERQDRELQIAREIQLSLFPAALPRLDGFDVAAESHSCFEVGGDHYDVIPLAQGRLGLAIADVSGKGTPAAILMASVHASLRATAGTCPLDALIGRLNAFLFQSTQASKYVTLFYAELEPKTRRLRYVNAGHIPPYWLRAGEPVRRLTAGGPVVGLLDDAVFQAGEILLAPGDTLAIVTDGVTEAMSADETEFGDERVAAVLSEASANAGSALASLLAAVEGWTGAGGFTDDVTALVLKVE